MLKRRNLTVNLLLTIFTCGLYGIIWFLNISDDTGVAAEDSTMSGALALLLTLVTCGLYRIYWSYKVGKLLDEAKESRGRKKTDSAVLYLIFSIFFMDIINYCIMQAELNELAEIK